MYFPAVLKATSSFTSLPLAFFIEAFTEDDVSIPAVLKALTPVK